MPTDLLDHNEGLRIATTRTNCVCTYSQNTIPQGEQALLIRRKQYDPDTGRIDYSKSYSTWVDLKYRTELENTLNSFDYESAEPHTTIAGNISVSSVSGVTVACGMCDSNIEVGTEAISFINYTNKDHPNVVWIHEKCIPILCGGLGNMEDYKEEIVARNI